MKENVVLQVNEYSQTNMEQNISVPQILSKVKKLPDSNEIQSLKDKLESAIMKDS
jgi:hypothetical protein